MTVQVVDVFPLKSSLDSQRGVLFGSTLILEDPLCAGEVVVRFTQYLSSEVSVVKIGEFEYEYPNDGIDRALKNQAYTAGWFKGLLEKMQEQFGTMTPKQS